MNWDRVLLKDLLITTKDGDWGPSEPDEGLVAYRVIRGTDFPRVRVGEVASVPRRYLPEKNVWRRTLEPWDVLIETAGGTQERPTGRTLLVTDRVLEALGEPATCASFARFLRVDKKKAEPQYVFWYLQNMYLQDEMRQHEVRHTGVGRFQYTRFAETQWIDLPPRDVQRDIAATLGALDDKVESNRRAIAIAVNLGESLFRDSVVGKRVLSDVANVTMGSSPPGRTYNEDRVGLPFYQGVKDFGVRHPSRRVWTDQPVRTAGANATLISVRAPVGRLNRATELCCIGRGLASVTSKYPSVCFYALMAADSVWRPFEQEGTVFGSMNRQSLTSALVPWPEMRDIDLLEARLASLDSEITSLTEESMKLESVRDALLPELLSGRIRVPEAAEPLASR